TVTGANFGAAMGTVSFNGLPATATSWSATSIVAPVPAGATSGNVVVKVGGAVSNGAVFTVLQPPVISSLTPGSAPIGTSVTITGTNFGASQGSSTVSFSGTVATPSGWSDTSITAPVPAGATSGNVVVTVAALSSNAQPFAVMPNPVISSLTPASGPVGATVM